MDFRGREGRRREDDHLLLRGGTGATMPLLLLCGCACDVMRASCVEMCLAFLRWCCFSTCRDCRQTRSFICYKDGCCFRVYRCHAETRPFLERRESS